MKLLRIKDNSQQKKDAFSQVARLTGKIADKTLEQLEREGVFVFPETVKDAEDIKDINLVRALVDLIQQDQSIKASDEFYIEPNGEKKKKAALGDLKEVCLPSFLLGVWHYVVVNRKDNGIGKKTYDMWCPSAGRGQRKFTAHIGEGILDNLTIFYADDVEKSETGSKPVETVITEDVQAEPVQQTVNNPFVFNFYQYGNNGTQIGHIENYYRSKKQED